jgi:hypothetical protein
MPYRDAVFEAEHAHGRIVNLEIPEASPEGEGYSTKLKPLLLRIPISEATVSAVCNPKML